MINSTSHQAPKSWTVAGSPKSRSVLDLADLEGYESALKEKQGLLEAVRAAKKRESKRAAYAKKKEERAERERMIRLELEEGSDDDDDEDTNYDAESSDSSKPQIKALAPDWVTTPIGFKRDAASDFEDSPKKKVEVRLAPAAIPVPAATTPAVATPTAPDAATAPVITVPVPVATLLTLTTTTIPFAITTTPSKRLQAPTPFTDRCIAKAFCS